MNDYYQVQRDSEDIQRQKEALRKNNEELDKLCKKICLIIGWSLVFCLMIYIIFLIIHQKSFTKFEIKYNTFKKYLL